MPQVLCQTGGKRKSHKLFPIWVQASDSSFMLTTEQIKMKLCEVSGYKFCSCLPCNNLKGI